MVEKSLTGRRRKREVPPPKKKRTRKDTDAEKHFKDGFEECYGHRPDINSGHAIKLGQRVGKNGKNLNLVKQKIDAWWTYKLPDRWEGNRTVGGFLGFYDSIPIGDADGEQPGRYAGVYNS